MTNNKDLIIAVLATFCLTATLLLAVPIRSQTQPPMYDPWIDNNHDGQINILDAIRLANDFGTSGDPTANVSVTNWPQRWQTSSIVDNLTFVWNISSVPSYFYIPWQFLATIPTNGFSRMRIYAEITEFTDLGSYSNSISISLYWNSTFDYGPAVGTNDWNMWNPSGGTSVNTTTGPTVIAFPQIQQTMTVLEPYVSFYITYNLNIQNLPAPTVAKLRISIGAYLRNE